MFAHVVAHDLKAPLNGIASLVDFVVEDYADRLDDDGRGQLQLIQTMAHRGVAMVDALKQLALLSSQPVHPRTLDLSPLAARAVKASRDRWPGLSIDAEIETPLPLVAASPVMMPVLIDCLVSNAVQYGDRSPRRVRLAPAGPAAAEVPQGHVAFAVSDDGIGIPERHREAVFDMFKRLHGVDKFGGGVGAGLALAKVIVERHGGTIHAAPAHGRGTTIVFTLPAAPAGPGV